MIERRLQPGHPRNVLPTDDWLPLPPNPPTIGDRRNGHGNHSSQSGPSIASQPVSIDQSSVQRPTPGHYRIRNIPLLGSKVTAVVSKDAPIAPDEASVATVPVVHRDPGPISQPS